MQVFLTGGSGHLASAVLPELVRGGHGVRALARSDAAGEQIASLGGVPVHGDLADLDTIRREAARADGVVHLAFDHGLMRSGRMGDAVGTELAVVDAFADALAGSDKPIIAASGTLTLSGIGRPGTEQDASPGSGGRADAELAMIAMADRGIRSSVVRISPITHSVLDRHGFARVLIGMAAQAGVARYPGDGANRWPAVHTLDVGTLFRAALEHGAAGAHWHAVGDTGIPIRTLMTSIGAHLGVPVERIPPEQADEAFGFLGSLIVLDNPMSSDITRRELGWEPVHPGLLEDFDEADYFPPR